MYVNRYAGRSSPLYMTLPGCHWWSAIRRIRRPSLRLSAASLLPQPCDDADEAQTIPSTETRCLQITPRGLPLVSLHTRTGFQADGTTIGICWSC